MGLRGKQNIFQFCDFMVSGASFKHKRPLDFSDYNINEKSPEIKLKSVGL